MLDWNPRAGPQAGGTLSVSVGIKTHGTSLSKQDHSYCTHDKGSSYSLGCSVFTPYMVHTLLG